MNDKMSTLCSGIHFDDDFEEMATQQFTQSSNASASEFGGGLSRITDFNACKEKGKQTIQHEEEDSRSDFDDSSDEDYREEESSGTSSEFDEDELQAELESESHSIIVQPSATSKVQTRPNMRVKKPTVSEVLKNIRDRAMAKRPKI